MTASDPKLPEPDLSGQTLDRYHLVRRMGVGGMGAVYEAEHTRLRKRFAVKLLRHELARDETFRKRFLREARAASAITHPNVVLISDFGETEDDRVFLVMEMLVGRDLQDLLDTERKLPWPRTREILVQVTSALHAAHLQDIIHRDMKPSNVFLADVPGKGDEDVVKVLDFGIAKLSGTMAEATVKLTSTDEIFGTVAYMAPEMAMGTNDDRRSDVYAVGVMMYRMLTGGLPFTQGNAFQILTQHINAPVPPPREQEPSIPDDVEAVLLKALAKSPSDRFASMEEFGRALRRGSLHAVDSHAELRTEQLVSPTKRAAAAPSIAVQKTTPLPSLSAHAAARPATEVSSPVATPPSDSAAIPIGVAPTIVSKPIAIGSSDSAPVPRPELPAATASPPISHDSGSIAAPQHEIHTAVSSSIAVARSEPEERRRSPLPFVLAGLGLVAAVGIAAFFVMDGPKEASKAAPTQGTPTVSQTNAPPAPEPEPVSPSKAEPAPEKISAAERDTRKPRSDDAANYGGVAKAVDPSEPSEPESEPTETEPVLEPKPEGNGTPKPKAPSRRGSNKPKTDQEVVVALKAKLAAKCKDAGTTKVKVEGVISPSGTISSLIITPPDGLGACAKKVVSPAKFDSTLGTRPMPRFSVEL